MKILDYPSTNKCSVTLKMRENPYSAGTLPRNPVGAHDASSPNHLVSWGLQLIP